MNELSKAVFLDRDGVINKERKDYVKTIDELEILPNIDHHIKLLKDAGYLIIVISNQSAINRGLTNHENVNKIHNSIQEFLKAHNTNIDAFYYCPHRPDENCECRKPKPGLLLRASSELGIDLKNSWFIGDYDSDMEAATQSGCKSLKIDENLSISSAVNQILNSN